MNEATIFRGGSDYSGPCQECGEMMVYEDWDKEAHQLLFGDQNIVGYYRCPNNHLFPISNAVVHDDFSRNRGMIDK